LKKPPAVGLAGDFAGLQGDLLRAEGKGFLDWVHGKFLRGRRKQKRSPEG
jgi:hypothetical protein